MSSILVAEEDVSEQLAQSCYLTVKWPEAKCASSKMKV